MPSMRTGRSKPVRPKAKRKLPTMAQAQKAKQPTIKRAGRTAGAKMGKATAMAQAQKSTASNTPNVTRGKRAGVKLGKAPAKKRPSMAQAQSTTRKRKPQARSRY